MWNKIIDETMWNKIIDDWKSDDQKSDDQKKKELDAYCPFLMPNAGNRFYSGCVNERCAWYVAERGECAVKVIATR